MTTTANVTENTAQSGSTVGIQAEQVHNSFVYQVLPDAPPARKFEVGVRYLEDGVPTRARELISDAIAHGYEDGKVRFHWVLAMLSKRAYRDLSAEERAQLGRTSDVLSKYPDDEWKRASKAICGLLDCLHGSGGDPRPAVDEIHALHTHQREQIFRHLDLVLTGGVKDSLWVEARQKAKESQLNRGRLDRVWAHFQPDPVEARARKPASISTTGSERVWATLWFLLFAAAVAYLGFLVLTQGVPLLVPAYLGALAGGYVGYRNAMAWWYRKKRVAARDREFANRRAGDTEPMEGFAAKIDHAFEYYFAKYTPPKLERDVWLAATTGIRATLRDEIVEIYRESRIKADRVHWLIRYLVGDVRKRWGTGALREYRTKYRTSSSTKLWCLFSFIGMLGAGVLVLFETFRKEPLLVGGATCGLLVFGMGFVPRWARIGYERWRFAEDEREYNRALAEREAAYHRWWEKLKSRRPTENEMEAWLNCDKTVFLDEALKHYRLAWRDVIAYSFLQTPASRYKRARVSHGPWRYSKYDIRLFLITEEGVREVGAELDFEKVTFARNQRINFRFDAVSSVHVTKTSELSYTLELTLMNGPAKSIPIVDPSELKSDVEESPATFSEINLDAAGFKPTLHILEGIAAEGKGWIERIPTAIALRRATSPDARTDERPAQADSDSSDEASPE